MFVSGNLNDTHSVVQVDESQPQLTLKCLIGANPLGQASILNIEWLKDKQILQQQQQQQTGINKQKDFGYTIERANQLHMGASYVNQNKRFLSQQNDQETLDSSQLLTNSKLHAISSLILSPLEQASAGSYSCEYKIIPSAVVVNQNSNNNNNNNNIIKGRSKQTIQVKVNEGE